MTLRYSLVVACMFALASWMPVANAQLHGRQVTRAGVLEFESKGYPTDATVERIRAEIDYQRAVQGPQDPWPRPGVENPHLRGAEPGARHVDVTRSELADFVTKR